MGNQFLRKRLRGILDGLKAVHTAGAGSSSASKGRERETFVDVFLSQCFPPTYRFGSGEITGGADSDSKVSGQIDIVIEYPFIPSFPMLGAHDPRLYLAEGVVAAIEVKSNASSHWDEVLRTKEKLVDVRREYVQTWGEMANSHFDYNSRVPLFVVGYEGWSSTDPMKEKLARGEVDGILIVNSELYVGNGIEAEGEWSLFGLLSNLYGIMLGYQLAEINLYRYPDFKGP